MEHKMISNALSYISDDYILEALPQEKGKVIPFQRWVMVAAAALILCVTGPFSKKMHVSTPITSVPETEVTIENPYTYMDSLDELNQAVGCDLKRLDLDGMSEETYIMIDNYLAEYSFEWHGGTYYIRAAKTQEDISGIYLANGKMISEVCTAEEIICEDDTWFVKWYDGDLQYNLSAMDSNSDDMAAVYSQCR